MRMEMEKEKPIDPLIYIYALTFCRSLSVELTNLSDLGKLCTSVYVHTNNKSGRHWT